MAATIQHRGPDDFGQYVDYDEKVFISMRRLSIIDLKNGSQPFSNTNKKVFVFVTGKSIISESLDHNWNN